MSRTLRAQGAVFAVTALCGIAMTLLLPRMSPRFELLTIAVLIAFVGVPHGALDTAFARQRFGLHTFRAWVVFSLGYVLVMLLVVASWWKMPVVFLTGFLGLSALHFSGDPVSGTPGIVRLVQGGAVLVLPAILYPTELTQLFGMLVGPGAAGVVAPVVSAASVPWACAVMVCITLTWSRSRQMSFELAAVATLACVVPPLLAFAIFFCGMHSARHILRTVSWAQFTEGRLAIGAVVAPMLGVACLAGVAWMLRGDVPLEPKVIQLIFVGLASVTVPHMLLIEPIRLVGWRDG